MDEDDEFGGSDDEEDDDDEEEDDEEGSDDDEDDELPIEKKSRKLDARRRRDEKLSEAEMQTNMISKEDRAVLPSGADIFESGDAPDLSTVQQRIQLIVRVLANFAEMREEGRYERFRWFFSPFLTIFSFQVAQRVHGAAHQGPCALLWLL